MTLQDPTHNWTVAGVTETFTYQNGETVDITYSTTRPNDNPGNEGWSAKLSDYQDGGTDYHSASIAYDQPIPETTYRFAAFHVEDDVQIYIDGEYANLNALLASGDITLTSSGDMNADGTGGPSGSDLISASTGRLGSDDHSGADPGRIYMTVHKPISSIWVQDMTATNGIYFDARIDDDPAYAPSTVAPCFTAGTLIETDQGPVAVETLQAGDLIRTKDHGFQPVKWVGESRVYASGFDVPLRIKAGTFGNTRDLVVSKRHKMLMNHTHLSLMFDVEEAFACAMHLRNDETITREPEGWVTYYHVLLPQHEVIYAEGAATESFYPDEGTLAGMAAKTKDELLEHFDPTTYGPQARPTLDPTRAMWIGRNLDILNGDDMGQTAAYENAMKAAQ